MTTRLWTSEIWKRVRAITTKKKSLSFSVYQQKTLKAINVCKIHWKMQPKYRRTTWKRRRGSLWHGRHVLLRRRRKNIEIKKERGPVHRTVANKERSACLHLAVLFLAFLQCVSWDDWSVKWILCGAQKWTLFRKQQRHAVRMYSSRAFIWVPTPLGFRL